jgi:hypothetical protein
MNERRADDGGRFATGWGGSRSGAGGYRLAPSMLLESGRSLAGRLHLQGTRNAGLGVDAATVRRRC